MWFASVRDLQWRKRRFAIGIVGTALVFGVTLLMAGLADSLRHEISGTIAATGADGWVVPVGTSGPLTSLSVMPAARADEVRDVPGVGRADPVLIIHDAVQTTGGVSTDVVLIGHTIGGLGSPQPRKGVAIRAPGEVLVDRTLGVGIGERITLSGTELRVVGTTSHTTLEGGLPVVFVDLETLQAVELGGASVALAVLVDGQPTGSLPAGLKLLTPDQVADDLLRRLGRLVESLNLVKFLLWGVAAAVVGSLVYLNALERTHDFAVMKATGASSRALFSGVALQAVALAGLAAVLAIAIAKLLIPAFPVPLILTSGPVIALPVVALSVGLIASFASLRRVISVDPVTAFGQ